MNITVAGQTESSKTYRPLPIPTSPRLSANLDRYDPSNGLACHLCGLAITPGNESWVLADAGQGNLIPVELGTVETPHGGYFAVGRSCAKRLPAAYIEKNPR